jgi:dTDP-4-dehydrorhamnose reductase
MNVPIRDGIDIHSLIHHFSGKHVLITGAEGMLGSAFSAIIRTQLPKCRLSALNRKQLDVCDQSALLSLSKRHIFDVIIHCAANVNADDCENNPKDCFNVQVNGTQNIMSLALAHEAKLFYPQSFLIFGENDGNVTEKTIPAPLSTYGRAKLEAENILLEKCPEAIIVRMGGFFGGEHLDKNFVGKFLRYMAERVSVADKIVQEVGSRVWQPTYTIDLAYNSLVLISNNKDGIYNMASHGQATFFELAVELIKFLKLNSKIDIVRAQDDVIKKMDVALRPKKIIMDNKRLRSENLDFQRPWRQGIHEYLSAPYFKRLFS